MVVVWYSCLIILFTISSSECFTPQLTFRKAFSSYHSPHVPSSLSAKPTTIQSHIGLHPIGRNILLKTASSSSTSTSGILIPDTILNKPGRGEVVAIGPGIRYTKGGEPVKLLVGDTVLYEQSAGRQFTHEGMEYIVVSDEDVKVRFTREMNPSTIECLHDQVLVKVSSSEDRGGQKGSGIIHVSSGDGPFTEGIVTKVGPGEKLASGEYEGCGVKPGDRVKFVPKRGNVIKMEGGSYILIHSNDIFVKL